MRKLLAAVALSALALAGCTWTWQPSPADPRPPVLRVSAQHDRVYDGGTYESVYVDQGSSGITFRNLVIDGRRAEGDGLLRDCLYVTGDAGDVTLEDSKCYAPKRDGVVVADTAPDATVTVRRTQFDLVSRYVVDLEPNVASQHVHDFAISETQVVENAATFGWLIRHSGCCDDVTAANNYWGASPLPAGHLGAGVWGL